MTKPFHRDELVARIHAIVRRSKGHAQSVIRTGKLAVNLDAKTVEVDGARVHLTGKEYPMLELLSLRKGTTLTKEMFLNHLYGGMDEPELKIIDVFICKLRKKLASASRRRELHRDRLGPRLRAARADRGGRAHPRLTTLRRALFGLSPPKTSDHSGPRQRWRGFCLSILSRTGPRHFRCVRHGACTIPTYVSAHSFARMPPDGSPAATELFSPRFR